MKIGIVEMLVHGNVGDVVQTTMTETRALLYVVLSSRHSKLAINFQKHAAYYIYHSGVFLEPSKFVRLRLHISMAMCMDERV